MKKITLFFVFLFSTVFYLQAQWTQVNADIVGEASNDKSGQISISSDGSIVAIGAPTNEQSGHVRIYQNSNNNWTQIGADIDSEALYDEFGFSVSLSSDGTIVAVGAPNNDGNGTNAGHVRVFQYSGTAWTQVGSDIDGEAAGDKSGYSVSLSSDGTVVAIGAYGNESNTGHVRIYNYNGTSWNQMGSDIDGVGAVDLFGFSASLSSDGLVVAIGAFRNDTNGIDSGQVSIYNFNGTTWNQIGDSINGESADDFSGREVSINSDGSIVAIGSPNASPQIGINSGYVRVYENSAGTWTQLGQNISGESDGDDFGDSVSLSANGSMIAIGAPGNNGSDGFSGHVRIYENIASTWVQIGLDIDGEGSEFKKLGFFGTVSISSDGTYVAIGAPSSIESKGVVRIYNYSVLSVNEVENSRFILFPNPSTGLININLENIRDTSIKVLSITGQVVYQKDDIKTTNFQIQFNNPAGIYFIEITSNQGKQILKLIKE